MHAATGVTFAIRSTIAREAAADVSRGTSGRERAGIGAPLLRCPRQISRSTLPRGQGWPRERRPPLRVGATPFAEFPGDVRGDDPRPGRREHAAGGRTERAGGHGTDHADRKFAADVDDLPRRPEAASSTQTSGRAPGSGTPPPRGRTDPRRRPGPPLAATPGTGQPPGVRGAAHRYAKGPAQQRPDRHGDRHTPVPRSRLWRSNRPTTRTPASENRPRRLDAGPGTRGSSRTRRADRAAEPAAPAVDDHS